MYNLLLEENNDLVVTSKQKIMQCSKLVDTLRFLVPVKYGDFNMEEFETVNLEYVLPVSRKYKSEILSVEAEKYVSDEEEYLQYLLPADTSLTAEAGDIELQLTFIKADLDDNGVPLQYVRKSNTAIVTIVPIAAWADIIPDEALTAIDQRLVKLDADIKAMADIGEVLDATKADNMEIGTIDQTEDKYLYLKANGNQIGDPIKISDLAETITENSPGGIVNVITI